MNLTPYLEDIERRISPEDESAILDSWRKFSFGEIPLGKRFEPPRRKIRESKLDWKHININDAIEDDELMILSQLEICHHALLKGGNTPLTMRPNYGVGIIASMYGAEKFVMPYSLDTLPNVRALKGGSDAVKEILTASPPSLSNGFGARVFSVADRFAHIRSKYPKIAAFVRFDNPDTQGPIDNCELIWGSELFYAFYDEPDLLKALLSHVSDTIASVILKFRKYIPFDGMTGYFGRLSKGGIILRNDSAMNLSPEFYREFCRPYDEKVLERLGGGAVHFCGKGDHFINLLSETKFLYSVDISQPHLNDMARVFSAIPDKNINLYIPHGDYELNGHRLNRIFIG